MSVICLSAVLRRLTVFMLLHCYVKIESPSTCFRIVKVDMHLLFSTASCAVFLFCIIIIIIINIIRHIQCIYRFYACIHHALQPRCVSVLNRFVLVAVLQFSTVVRSRVFVIFTLRLHISSGCLSTAVTAHRWLGRWIPDE